MRRRVIAASVVSIMCVCQPVWAACSADQRSIADAVVREAPLPLMRPLLTNCGEGILDSMVNGGFLGSILSSIGASFFDQLSAIVCGNLPNVGNLPPLTGNGGLSFGNPYVGDVSGPDMTLGTPPQLNPQYGTQSAVQEGAAKSAAPRRSPITVPPPYLPGAVRPAQTPAPTPGPVYTPGTQKR